MKNIDVFKTVEQLRATKVTLKYLYILDVTRRQRP